MKNLICFILLLFISMAAKGQSIERQVIASGGKSMVTEALHISFTIGEAVVSSLQNENILLSQGFQQGEPKLPTNVYQWAELRFSVYPNPTKGQVWLTLNKEENSPLSIRIFNSDGRYLEQLNMHENIQNVELDLGMWPAGSYFIIIENQLGQRGIASIVKL